MFILQVLKPKVYPCPDQTPVDQNVPQEFNLDYTPGVNLDYTRV